MGPICASFPLTTAIFPIFLISRADVARTLLQGPYATLCTLTRAATAALLKGSLPLLEASDSLDCLLEAIGDTAKQTYKESAVTDGAGGKQAKPTRIKGRAAIGKHAIPALLDIILLLK